MIRRFAMAIGVCVLAIVAAVPAARAEAASLYDLKLELIDQHGNAVPFDLYRGHPVLVAMFYATCPATCPLLVSALHGVEGKLQGDAKEQVRFLLISLDPKRDTPQELTRVLERHRIADTHWTLASPAADRVRDLAAVLGVKYREMAGGGYNHSPIVSLVDGRGAIVRQFPGPKPSVNEIVESLTALIHEKKE